MEHGFTGIKKKLGFGVMRLPKIGEEVDIPAVTTMVDAFMQAGFNYFDTARPYLQGQSEQAVKICVAQRYPRESFILTNKLSNSCFEKEEDIRPFFQSQLEACGGEYFDFYLMHAMNAKSHEKYQATHAYDVAQQLKAEGKIRHVGFSFHDTAEVLDKILTDRPELEVVQLQLNYLDWEDPEVQSRACYEVCVKHNKPVIVMEPVRGGRLANVPEQAKALMTSGSPASYAIRFAAGWDNVVMVLSGMSSMAQMQDNLSFMQHFQPLSPEEMALSGKVRTLYQAQNKIPCTACRYCTDGCPAGIDIPELFACLNDQRAGQEQTLSRYAAFETKADACVECGQCEAVCPQHLSIRELLKQVQKALTP